MQDKDSPIFSRWTEDILLATGFLTRLPVPLSESTRQRPLAETAWAFPVVGLIVGGLAALALALGFRWHLHPLVCALFGIGAAVLITGALHEDGLADVADGFGGGQSVSDKLRIMRDSRIGSYGVLALIFSVALRAGALSSLTTPTQAALALIAAATLSRAMVAAVMSQLDRARTDGLSAGAGKPDGLDALVAIVIAAVTAFVLLGTQGWGVLIVAFVATAVFAFIAKRQIGGQTGDVLGAVQQISETAVLICIAAMN